MSTRAILVCAIALPAAAIADVRLPALFSDGMVLQRDAPIPVWGWAEPWERVSIALGSQRRLAIATLDGKWRVTFGAMPAAESPVAFEVSGRNALRIQNVAVGDVWVCSGQSNMAWTLRQSARAEEFIRETSDPHLRMFTVEHRTANSPQSDCKGSWRHASPETAGQFSAVGYHFARHLRIDRGVPVGMIHSSWGGTPAEAWTREGALTGDPILEPLLARKHDERVAPQHKPGRLYNGMIAPLIPYRIRGAIWYQGESNVSRAFQYRALFPAMIRNWREDWGQGAFPFYFVQIAPYDYGDMNPLFAAELREAQRLALSAVPNTGMAVTLDIGDPKDIHPGNKHEVGRRLALFEIARVRGSGIPHSGPRFQGIAIEGSRIRVRFANCGSGLATRDGKAPSHFEIAGEDRAYAPAQARIEGDTVVLWSAGVGRPVAARFAFRDDAEPNLVDGFGLPGSSFKSDDWPWASTGNR